MSLFPLTNNLPLAGTAAVEGLVLEVAVEDHAVAEEAAVGLGGEPEPGLDGGEAGAPVPGPLPGQVRARGPPASRRAPLVVLHHLQDHPHQVQLLLGEQLHEGGVGLALAVGVGGLPGVSPAAGEEQAAQAWAVGGVKKRKEIL